MGEEAELPEKEKNGSSGTEKGRARDTEYCVLSLFFLSDFRISKFSDFRISGSGGSSPAFSPSGIFSGAAASAGLSGPVMIPFHALLSADIRPGKAVFFHGEKIDLSFQPDQIIHFDFRIKQQNPAIFFNFHPSVRIAF